eukprot:UN06521
MAAKELQFNNTISHEVVSELLQPRGCYITYTDNGLKVYYNKNTKSTTNCGSVGGGNTQGRKIGNTNSLIFLKLELNQNKDEVLITLKGPTDKWFGVGFAAHKMEDEPYAIIIHYDGDGKTAVHERKLGNYYEGTLLKTSVTVILDKIENGIREVTLRRAMKGITSDHYTFDINKSKIAFINAIGKSGEFAIHDKKAASSITLFGDGSSICLCKTTGTPGTIDGVGFDYSCNPFPESNLLMTHNPQCNITTYTGGLKCCLDGTYLIDSDQSVPPFVDEFHLKLRVYYEDYNTTKPQIRPYFMTHAVEGGDFEHDVVKCPPGQPSTQCMAQTYGHWKVSEMLNLDPNCDTQGNPFCQPESEYDDKKGLYLIFASPHCHGPQCKSMELWNADTGELLCVTHPNIGTGEEAHNEKGYLVSIPNCVWGFDEGLAEPPIVHLDTTLYSIVREDSSIAHTGAMHIYLF